MAKVLSESSELPAEPPRPSSPSLGRRSPPPSTAEALGIVSDTGPRRAPVRERSRAGFGLRAHPFLLIGSPDSWLVIEGEDGALAFRPQLFEQPLIPGIGGVVGRYDRTTGRTSLNIDAVLDTARAQGRPVVPLDEGYCVSEGIAAEASVDTNSGVPILPGQPTYRASWDSPEQYWRLIEAWQLQGILPAAPDDVALELFYQSRARALAMASAAPSTTNEAAASKAALARDVAFIAAECGRRGLRIDVDAGGAAARASAALAAAGVP